MISADVAYVQYASIEWLHGDDDRLVLEVDEARVRLEDIAVEADAQEVGIGRRRLLDCSSTRVC